MGRGKKVGDDGSEGMPFTEADNKLSVRRYKAYVSFTKKHKGVAFEDILKKLPLNGGSKLGCGCTRFEHLQKDECRNPEYRNERCKGRTKTDAACGKKAGHTGVHRSIFYIQQQVKRNRERKREARR